MMSGLPGQVGRLIVEHKSFHDRNILVTACGRICKRNSNPRPHHYEPSTMK